MGARPGPAGQFWRGVAFAFFFVCYLLGAGVLVAKADPPPVYNPPAEIATEPSAPEGQPSCPVLELEPFEGEDAAAGETRLLRGEAASACAALSARLDRIRERLWWLVAEALDAKQQRVLTNTLLTEVRDRLASPVPVQVQDWTYEPPIDTQDASSAEGSDALLEAVDASGNATKEALWFLCGLLVMLAGSALYRHLKP
jgi:hypothetical protein